MLVKNTTMADRPLLASVTAAQSGGQSTAPAPESASVVTSVISTNHYDKYIESRALATSNVAGTGSTSSSQDGAIPAGNTVSMVLPSTVTTVGTVPSSTAPAPALLSSVPTLAAPSSVDKALALDPSITALAQVLPPKIILPSLFLQTSDDEDAVQDNAFSNDENPFTASDYGTSGDTKVDYNNSPPNNMHFQTTKTIMSHDRRSAEIHLNHLLYG